MKNTYMVEFNVPQDINKEFVELIPIQWVKVNELLLKGDLRSYTLSADNSKVWAVVAAENQNGLENILTSLPLDEYMQSSVVPLAFNHQSAEVRMPPICMN